MANLPVSLTGEYGSPYAEFPLCEAINLLDPAAMKRVI